MSKERRLDDEELSEIVGAGNLECSGLPRWCRCPSPPPERETGVEDEGQPGGGSNQNLEED